MLATLATHELDAMSNREWRVLPLFSLLPDNLGRVAFVAAHVPLFWWLIHSMPCRDSAADSGTMAARLRCSADTQAQAAGEAIQHHATDHDAQAQATGEAIQHPVTDHAAATLLVAPAAPWSNISASRALGAFCILHVGLHWAFSGQAEYRFGSAESKLWIILPALFGAAALAS